MSRIRRSTPDGAGCTGWTSRLAGAALAASLLVVVAPGPEASAQETPEPEEAIRVFLDCQTFFCDFDHFRREIRFVHWVRDREDADLHVLVTSETTGAGGRRFSLLYLGRSELAGRRDTLTYSSNPTDTDDEVRAGLTRTLELGLVRYAAGTPAAERIDVKYRAPGGEEEAAAEAVPEEDPWNLWVFTTRLRTSLRAEERSDRVSLSGGVEANRTSREWKLEFEVDGRYSEQNFEVTPEPDPRVITSVSRNYGAEALAVKSLTGHWSAGLQASANHSTFRNQDLALRVAPALEWNLFPYAESTRRQLRFLYEVGANRFDYDQRTILGETEETRFDQTLRVTLDVKQPWGSTSASVEGGHFLDDLSQNRVGVSGFLNLRIVRGLSLNLFGRAERVADQINLPARGASEEEILLRQQELLTDFRYSVSIGLSYTFGSIYNNVVNPRFGGSRRMFFF